MRVSPGGSLRLPPVVFGRLIEVDFEGSPTHDLHTLHSLVYYTFNQAVKHAASRRGAIGKVNGIHFAIPYVLIFSHFTLIIHGGEMKIRRQIPVFIALFFAGTAGSLFSQTAFIERYQARVSATQAEQPHWVTPLITVTPRLEQEIRTDFVHQYNAKRFATWNYGNGKGLELIPERHTEIIVNVPPFYNRSNGASDGFGDISFLGKYRFYARNEEHGSAIVTAFLAGSVPTGKNSNGSCCAVVTPTLAVGKGFGQFAFTSTAGGSLPVTGEQKLGHTITWNNVAQYRIAKSGIARFFWPEAELNSSFYKGGSTDGDTAVFVTPGLIVGRIPLSHDAKGKPGRLGLTFGVGEQIAVSHYHPNNHSTVITFRLPF